MSETSPQWKGSSPWIGASTKEEICRRSCSEWVSASNCDERVEGYIIIEYAFTYCFFPPQNLYESIKNEPFKIPEDDGNDLTHTFFNPDREGWLLKLGLLYMSIYLYVCSVYNSIYHSFMVSNLWVYPYFSIDWVYSSIIQHLAVLIRIT